MSRIWTTSGISGSAMDPFKNLATPVSCRNYKKDVGYGETGNNLSFKI